MTLQQLQSLHIAGRQGLRVSRDWAAHGRARLRRQPEHRPGTCHYPHPTQPSPTQHTTHLGAYRRHPLQVPTLEAFLQACRSSGLRRPLLVEVKKLSSDQGRERFLRLLRCARARGHLRQRPRCCAEPLRSGWCRSRRSCWPSSVPRPPPLQRLPAARAGGAGGAPAARDPLLPWVPRRHRLPHVLCRQLWQAGWAAALLGPACCARALAPALQQLPALCWPWVTTHQRTLPPPRRRDAVAPLGAALQ
jgi:hypothetical protein